MIIPSKNSLDLLEHISDNLDGKTFHHHYHVLLDIANSYSLTEKLVYLEIGAYAGGSACLMVQRPNTKVISIDLGWPIEPQTVIKNVAKFNKHKNEYTYIQGNSTSFEIVERLKEINVDILFIDGDHSYVGVWNDFINFSKLVKPGGYIIFDDYNDKLKSPMVKSAVDHIVNQLRDDYNIIGTLKNVYNARGFTNEENDGNCYIIQKKIENTIPIGIVMPTYNKPNGTSLPLLKKTLDSIFSQTYTNFKIFIVGDYFYPEQDILTLLDMFPKNKIKFKNLQYARERTLHKEKITIWKYGGVNALNHAIDEAINDGYDYIAHMDHDDQWAPNHLEEIYKCIKLTNADFICTKANHLDSFILPVTLITEQDYIKFLPIYSGLVHSSSCMNFSKIPLRYRDLYLDNGYYDNFLTGDSDMWERVRKFMIKNKLVGMCVNKVTVNHIVEHKQDE